MYFKARIQQCQHETSDEKKKKKRLRKENIEQRQSWRRKDKRAGNRAAGTETMFSEKVEVSVETTISSSSSSVLRFH